MPLESYRPAAARDSLESALEDCGRGVRPDGGGGGGVEEGEQRGAEWRALVARATAENRLLTNGFGELREGGVEHDVYFHQPTMRWVKATKPWGAGFTVEVYDGCPLFRPATPAEYLRRMLLQNRRFSDDVRFEGVLYTKEGMRLVISQPDVAGHAPELAVMDRELAEQHGFRRLDLPPLGYYHSCSYFDGAVGLFDAHPANFVVAGGLLVPIDVILVDFDADATSYLRSRIIRQ